MVTYYRIQFGHYTLEEMQSYTSIDAGGDGGKEGVCACDSPHQLIANTAFSSDPHFTKDAEIVVMRGRKLMDIYDGVRIYPTEILAYMTRKSVQIRR